MDEVEVEVEVEVEILQMDANMITQNTGDYSVNLDDFMHEVDNILVKVEMFEQQVNDIEHFYSSTCQKQHLKGNSTVKDKESETNIICLKRQKQDSSQREEAAKKRMQELMSQLGTILHQITQHKWAWPFMEPVDAKGLGLQDYLEVIEKPMDFGTITKLLEAKDGTGYKDVWEVQADVRLVFKNAMKYNTEKNDFHVMAKSLLEKFEEKWLQLLPKVMEEEKRLKAEEAETQLETQLAQEAGYAQLARDISNELHEVDGHLEELKEKVIQQCRKMSTEDKKIIAAALTRLSAEDLRKVVNIVVDNNPRFEGAVEEVDLDLDAQSESTLWKLKVFLKGALETQSKCAGEVDVNKTAQSSHFNKKRAIYNALARTANKNAKRASF